MEKEKDPLPAVHRGLATLLVTNGGTVGRRGGWGPEYTHPQGLLLLETSWPGKERGASELLADLSRQLSTCAHGSDNITGTQEPCLWNLPRL